jgi:hypothetical protein
MSFGSVDEAGKLSAADHQGAASGYQWAEVLRVRVGARRVLTCRSEPFLQIARGGFAAEAGKGISPGVAVMLRCEGCGKLGEGPMDGWRALLGVDVDDEDAPDQAYQRRPHLTTPSTPPA